jgi:hypothetical protein
METMRVTIDLCGSKKIIEVDIPSELDPDATISNVTALIDDAIMDQGFMSLVIEDK